MRCWLKTQSVNSEPLVGKAGPPVVRKNIGRLESGVFSGIFGELNADEGDPTNDGCAADCLRVHAMRSGSWYSASARIVARG